MARWRSALAAGSVGLVAGLCVVLPSTPASAAPADLVIDYDCYGVGNTYTIAKYAPVRLRTRLTFATDLVVGGALDLKWSIAYKDGSRFSSPGYYAAGAQMNVLGNAQITGAWQGVLQPTGATTISSKLRMDDPLALPAGIADPGQIIKAGVIKIEPKDIVVDFVPPDGEATVNNGNDGDNPRFHTINYGGPWTEFDDRLSSEHHIHNDYHETSAQGASAELKFIGTGVKYIGPRDREGGPVKVSLDGAQRAEVDPSRNIEDDPVNEVHNGGFTLWESPQDLAYGEHTIKIENGSAKKAWLDAFIVTTNTSKVPTDFHRASCKLVSSPVSVEVTVREKPGQSPTVSPTVSPTISPTVSPTQTPTGTPATTPTRHHNGNHNSGNQTTVDRLVSVHGTTTVTATPTVKTSTGPTATNYVAAQVKKTPFGGVPSGEAPEPSRQPYALMAGGTVLLLGSAAGGLAMRRRRAAHAGNRR
ncbi:hypothetical protein [Nonomuraea sp. NPDC003754]